MLLSPIKHERIGATARGLRLLCAIALLATCPVGAATPATVSGTPLETNLATVTLSAEARNRLAIVTASVVETPFRAWRSYPGTVVVAWNPAAPPTRPAPIDSWTSATLMQFGDRQLAAEGAVRVAIVDVTFAERALERAKSLLKAKAARVTDVDEAERGLARAKAQLLTAEMRRDLLGPSVFNDARTLWVSVPVFAGELGRIDQTAAAEIAPLGAKAGAPYQTSSPVGLAPAGDATQATLTLLYHCPQDAGFLPGQRIRVRLPLDDSRVVKSLPWSAVLHDIYGGQWVYVQIGDRQYQRRRIQVRAVRRGIALLDQGPEIGLRVVSEGAAELFGTEFGVGH